MWPSSSCRAAHSGDSHFHVTLSTVSVVSTGLHREPHTKKHITRSSTLKPAG